MKNIAKFAVDVLLYAFMGGSKLFYIWLGILSFLVLMMAFGSYTQTVEGMVVTNYNDQVTPLTHTAHIGFRYKWRYGYLITPGLLVRIKPDNPLEIIGTLRARIQDKIWGGLQYTYLGAVGLSVGGYITANIGFNYAYEFPTSQIYRATAGSHEVILAIKLKNKNYSRAYLW